MWTKCQSFIYAAEQGSFAKAAEKLYMTSTAVMKQINNLEQEVGVPLFERNSQGVSLTEPGKSLYKDIRFIIEFYNESVLRAQELVMEKWKTIRIGNSTLAPSYFLVDLWPEIQRKNHEYRLQIISYKDSSKYPEEIAAHLGFEIDMIAGVLGWTFPGMKKIEQQILRWQSVCCAVSIQHPLAARPSLQIRDLYEEKVMVLEKGQNQYFDQVRQEMEKTGRIQLWDFPYYSDEIFHRCEMTRSIILTVQGWKFVSPMLKLIPVEWDYTIPFGIMYRKDAHESVKEFSQLAMRISKNMFGCHTDSGKI